MRFYVSVLEFCLFSHFKIAAFYLNKCLEGEKKSLVFPKVTTISDLGFISEIFQVLHQSILTGSEIRFYK